MTDSHHDVTQHVKIDEICVQFERALRQGESPGVNELLAGVAESATSLLLTQLLLVELEHHQQTGASPHLDDYVARFPAHETAVRDAFQQHNNLAVARQISDASADQPHLATPQDATILHPLIAEQAGSKVGVYKLLEQIGEGGMGVVYMAQQDEPVRRRVALTIIKPGMDSKQVVARFEAERQALAMMEHPNIAKVLDAGATESGRPYFVMELVKGIPITQYCDEHRLTACQRLQLFASVCKAVQHAHQKGIIHCDLKPSNVLVAEYDHEPIAKIIDFGVAKATSLELTEKTLFTQFGQIVGTLDYMSPEQAKFNQLDIDTRSDVYSLGVLLYELLTGGTPIEKDRLRTTGLEEILRIIREEDPPRPSTRLSSSAMLPALAECRNTDPCKLAVQLREDVDWIVVKALAKERDERYQTAAAMADDIERHLQDRPIEARRPSAVGRVRRYMRRHKTAVTLTTLAVAATVTAVTLGIIAYIGRLDRAKQRMALQATRANAEVSRLEAERKNKAREVEMPRVKQLLQERRHLEALQLAREVREVLAEDPAFSELWKSLTVEVSLNVDPPGTAVYYRGARDVGGEWILAGASPLINVRLPKTDLRFRFLNEGYVTQEFQRPFPQFTEWVTKFTLRPEQGDPDGMVFVRGTQAANWNQLPTAIAGFFIDRYEVSNAEFQVFVDNGGYQNSEF